MKLSKLFTKTLREAPSDETAKNARLLIRGGFVSKVMAGVYEYLPFGLRVLNKINNIIREEMDVVGGQELNMSVFQNKEIWQATGRWDSAKEVMYQFKDNFNKDQGLGFTHEEPIAATARHFISSYKDLPKAVYQIQTKFRNEARAKSGLLRGREFLMKDLYSFHADQNDLDEYYEKVADAYSRIFERVGVSAVRTFASGGLFSKYSDEFQVVADIGEDTIYVNEKENRAVNKEVYNEDVLADLKWNKSNLTERSSIEVGNIFKLGTKFSEPLGLTYTDADGNLRPVIMASYGIGPGRLMGTVVEVSCDEEGIIWPENIAPYKVHLISLEQNKKADKVYDDLANSGAEVLYDDREDKTAGEKFADADLIGCPIRIVVSKKTLEKESVELKLRNEKDFKLVKLSDISQSL
ncbi:MAG: prolyl-tRNA synthetase [Candidatus Yanofskybacteria bacterium RIFCSPLOWO2_01_FULL_41_34]|uniref:Proline--tRNA ligase n=1 Tax=Candidatus Yanofskybacteria bacterium RIFCSPHIGHO2_01_FULL_41_26 TaxID=1802661 RepID=A0A1F8EGR7_9BACT|nr:MAG: prolyl-tRNA synthetase [Candidatus Yanofskybacteria bacterium RIFCSPHIGHO2_01_FULL_41_26]OGN20932.1 MAG: prolyl-tRNA synthetase [Candidatus Yanofskybacteria bacterium RIFCSPLOWO2_01_FULL_41_34]